MAGIVMFKFGQVVPIEYQIGIADRRRSTVLSCCGRRVVLRGDSAFPTR